MWEAADGSGAGPRQAAGAGLVGREDVLAQLRRAVEDAARGRGRLLLLTGEAGIGKTAVAAGAEGRGVRVVWGWSWQGEGAPAYWPWVQVFRSLVTKGGPPQPPPAPSLARLLPELPGSADPPVDVDELAPAARFRLLDELTSVLLAASEDRPLAVVLDDLQWADPPSIHLLDFVARQLPAARVLVLGTYRDLDQPPNDPLAPLLADLAARGTVIPMGALSEDEVARLVATIVGGEPEPALVAAVRRRTGGNPFFVQQVTRLLLAQAGATDGPLTGESVGITFGVREAIERRLARLSPRCVEVVVTAGAVVGPEFTAGLLARVTGEPAGAVRDLLGEAARAHVLAGPTGPFRPYRFAHDLFRESIVEGLGGEVRARLHCGSAGPSRERDAGGVVPPAQLANHFAQAGAGAADAAGRYAARRRRRPPGAWPTRRPPASGRGRSRPWRGQRGPTAGDGPSSCSSWPPPAAGPAIWPAAGRPLSRRRSSPGEPPTRRGSPGPRSACRPSARGAGPRWSTSSSRCWRRLLTPLATRTHPCGPGCWPAWQGSWPGTGWTSPARRGSPTRPSSRPAGPATGRPWPRACCRSTTPAGRQGTQPTGWRSPGRSPSLPATAGISSCWPRPVCCERPTGSSSPTLRSRSSWPSSSRAPRPWDNRGWTMPRWHAGRCRRCWPDGSARRSGSSPRRPPLAGKSASRMRKTSSSRSSGSSAAFKAAGLSCSRRRGRCSRTTRRRDATSWP